MDQVNGSHKPYVSADECRRIVELILSKEEMYCLWMAKIYPQFNLPMHRIHPFSPFNRDSRCSESNRGGCRSFVGQSPLPDIGERAQDDN